MKEKADMNQSVLKLKQDLLGVLSHYPDVLSAYVFGSTVQGVDRSTSDVDIAIRVDESIPVDVRFRLRLQLINEFEESLGRKVDVVVMNSASLKMIRQILVNGEMIFARNIEEELDYRVRKQKEFFDFKYYLDKDIQETREFFGSSHGHRS